jgi:hypothetical protein
MTTTESIEDFIKLMRSTAQCDEGPELSMRPGLLTIRYDAETDSGRAWTTVRFPGAVALRVTPEPAVSSLMVRAYSKVGLVRGSAWLASLLEAKGDGRLPHDLKHFVVFFDHHGAVETIARSCEVQE